MENLTDREREVLKAQLDDLFNRVADTVRLPMEEFRDHNYPVIGPVEDKMPRVATSTLDDNQRRYLVRIFEIFASLCLEKSILVAGQGSTTFRKQVVGSIGRVQQELDLAFEERERKG